MTHQLSSFGKSGDSVFHGPRFDPRWWWTFRDLFLGYSTVRVRWPKLASEVDSTLQGLHIKRFYLPKCSYGNGYLLDNRHTPSRGGVASVTVGWAMRARSCTRRMTWHVASLHPPPPAAPQSHPHAVPRLRLYYYDLVSLGGNIYILVTLLYLSGLQ